MGWGVGRGDLGREGKEGVSWINCMLAGWVIVLCSVEFVWDGGEEGQWSSGFCFSFLIIDHLA